MRAPVPYPVQGALAFSLWEVFTPSELPHSGTPDCLQAPSHWRYTSPYTWAICAARWLFLVKYLRAAQTSKPRHCPQARGWLEGPLTPSRTTVPGKALALRKLSALPTLTPSSGNPSVCTVPCILGTAAPDCSCPRHTPLTSPTPHPDFSLRPRPYSVAASVAEPPWPHSLWLMCLMPSLDYTLGQTGCRSCWLFCPRRPVLGSAQGRCSATLW